MTSTAHPLDTVVLAAFQDSTPPRPTRHPERAGTACLCRSPEPCYGHPAGPVPVGPGEVTYADYLAGAVPEDTEPPGGWAVSVCQCAAPEPCRVHPDDRPLLARPPAWNAPHPDSPVARTRRRLAHDRTLGVLPGSEPGQGTAVLPYLTDEELGAWTHALLAEHHRRQQRFLDYRTGAKAAEIRDNARRLA